VSQKTTSAYNFVNKSVENRPVFMIFGTQYHYEILHPRVINLPDTEPILLQK